MKKLRALFMFIAALVVLAGVYPHKSYAAEPNLIANPSVESADATGQPTGWTASTWGTNTPTFTYATNGYNGTRSMQVAISNYTDGDAKWKFNAVAIAPSTSYSYSDYYKSTTASEVVNEYTDVNGVVSYQWLASLPASANWQVNTISFTTPANVKTVSTLHFIMSVGTMQTDSFVLMKNAVVTAGTIANPGMEESIDNVSPTGWYRGGWGTNTAKYEYMNVNNSGSRSAKVTVTNYKDGDAKWYFNPITLAGGKTYKISFWYKTNTAPHVAAQIAKADGTFQYIGLVDPLVATKDKWAQYTGTFAVPADAVKTTVFMYIASNGYVQTDDYSLGEYKMVGFNRPLLTLTFDDGPDENITNALPLINSYGFKTTHCYLSGNVEGNPQEVKYVQQIKNAGHEICSHTVSHPMLTTLSASSLDYELKHSQQYLESITGQKITTFVSPYGDYNAAVIAAAKKYYVAHRTVDAGYNSKDNFDAYRLRVQNMLSTTTAQEVQSWIDTAKATNTWLILVYHRIAPDPNTYDTSVNDFKVQLEMYKKSGITIKTYKDALAEVQSQK